MGSNKGPTHRMVARQMLRGRFDELIKSLSADHGITTNSLMQHLQGFAGFLRGNQIKREAEWTILKDER